MSSDHSARSVRQQHSVASPFRVLADTPTPAPTPPKRLSSCPLAMPAHRLLLLLRLGSPRCLPPRPNSAVPPRSCSAAAATNSSTYCESSSDPPQVPSRSSSSAPGAATLPSSPRRVHQHHRGFAPIKGGSMYQHKKKELAARL